MKNNEPFLPFTLIFTSELIIAPSTNAPLSEEEIKKVILEGEHNEIN